LRALLTRNATVVEVLARAAVLALPDWYLVAGCLYQTVWNVVTGQPPESGILGYDLAYYDSSDLSWHAGDAITREGGRLFGDLPAPVQIRNQARVHLWYEQKFGVACPPHDCAEAATGTFEAPLPALACALSPARIGASAPRTGWGTCSASSPAPARCWHPATSTRPRPPGGGSNGHL